ncbi:MAG: fibronectin type III domain-containing protein [Candidatus Doudnabacteria bacterium]|jgi:hypothetical protein
MRLGMAPFVLFLIQGGAFGQNLCNLNTDSVVNIQDVTLAVSMGLGKIACISLVYKPGVCNIVVVQRVVNSALGKACIVGAGGQHYVTLTWVASTSPNVSYKVLRGETTGGPYQQVSSSPVVNLTYIDALVLAGRTYYYVVRAVDSNGNESVDSNEASAMVPAP